MDECLWCQLNHEAWEAAEKEKGYLEQKDLVYAPTFILDGGNEHLPEPGVGPAELRKATSLRRWVHDLRSVGKGIAQCGLGAARDGFLAAIAEGDYDQEAESSDA